MEPTVTSALAILVGCVVVIRPYPTEKFTLLSKVYKERMEQAPGSLNELGIFNISNPSSAQLDSTGAPSAELNHEIELMRSCHPWDGQPTLPAMAEVVAQLTGTLDPLTNCR